VVDWTHKMSRKVVLQSRVVIFQRVHYYESKPYPITIMAPAKAEVGESSMTAAKKALKPNPNGITNYELPW